MFFSGAVSYKHVGGELPPVVPEATEHGNADHQPAEEEKKIASDLPKLGVCVIRNGIRAKSPDPERELVRRFPRRRSKPRDQNYGALEAMGVRQDDLDVSEKDDRSQSSNSSVNGSKDSDKEISSCHSAIQSSSERLQAVSFRSQ